MEKPFLELMERYYLFFRLNTRFGFIDAVIASTADGVPLIRGTLLSKLNRE